MSKDEGRDWTKEVAQRLVEREVAENLRREEDAISLRDHFAATALLGLLNGSIGCYGSELKATALRWGVRDATEREFSLTGAFSEAAYVLADAMLQARAENPAK